MSENDDFNAKVARGIELRNQGKLWPEVKDIIRREFGKGPGQRAQKLIRNGAHPPASDQVAIDETTINNEDDFNIWLLGMLRTELQLEPDFSIARYVPLHYREANMFNKFETDLLIQKGTIPLVVIELKFRKFTTHDVIVYSAKANKHRIFYPQLRYGMVIGQMQNLPGRFFYHNEGFDFGMVMNVTRADVHVLAELIKRQINIALDYNEVLNARKDVKIFEEGVKFS